MRWIKINLSRCHSNIFEKYGFHVHEKAPRLKEAERQHIKFRNNVFSLLIFIFTEVFVIFHCQSEVPGRFYILEELSCLEVIHRFISFMKLLYFLFGFMLVVSLSNSNIHICCSERSQILDSSSSNLPFFSSICCFLSPHKSSLHEAATPLHSRDGVGWVMR